MKRKNRKLSKKLCKDVSNATYRKNQKDDFHIDIKTLKRLYWDIGLSQNQIADIFGITQTYIDHKMVEFQIPTRKGRKPKRKSPKKRKRTLPNTYEQKIIDLCIEMKYPFEFVGNKRNVIDGKSPDFISSDNRRCIIETYAKYYHKKDYEITRAKFFRDRGYEILFLNDNDLNKKEWKDICKMKIEKFMEEGK